MPPIAKATPRPAAAACAILGSPIRWRAFLTTPCRSKRIGPPKKQRATDCSAALSTGSGEESYFRLVIAVKSAESLTMPAAPHQFEPVPPGLIGVTLVVPEALKALVNALQLPFARVWSAQGRCGVK